VLGEWDNPYMTMAFGNEADELRALGTLLEKGYVYRGLKPVNWCFDCGSALAEAEVEYQDKRDPAIDVGFPFAEPEKLAPPSAWPRCRPGDGFIVIWTTTPWTIPSNQALNVHPEVTTRWSDRARRQAAAADPRARPGRSVLERYKLEGTSSPPPGRQALGGMRFKHPLHAPTRSTTALSPVYLADYVTTESGTGVVHSAPAYGLEDFVSCKAHGMKDDDILNPVMGDGRFASTLPLFGGMTIWEASKPICAALTEAGALFELKMFDHSYMHCWRHKTPIVYRATSSGSPAWTSRRRTAARPCARPRWPASPTPVLPGLGPGAPARHDRQPSGLDPVAPAPVGRADGLLHPQGNRRAAPAHPGAAGAGGQADRANGIDAWHARPRELLGDDADIYEKNRDTLDVWFDSGTTHQTVLRGSHKAAVAFPADLYLEGSDQHRGWFHSSLLTSSMLNGRPPYKALLTHGFTVDANGKKMSKSLGNTLAPQKISDTLGADILRLWVASTDYTGELSIGEEILKRVTEAYRRIRNTLRFLLANTSDFDPRKERRAGGRDARDRPLRAGRNMARLQADIAAHFERYEFHPVVARLQNFCSEDLGGFYLDILKDRLYTTGVDSPRAARRRPRCGTSRTACCA
jgi:isoleucyl-tRNA synthetase